MICRLAHEMSAVHRRRRDGLSLLEAVVALAILGFSMVALVQLVNLANDRALETQRQAQGTMLCQRKLAEISIGAEAPTSSGYAEFPADEELTGWQWRAEVSTTIDGSYNVEVWVKYEAQGALTEFQLGQVILDPTIRGSNQDAPVVAPPSGSSNSSSANSASNSSSTPSTTTPSTTTPSTTTPSTTTPSTSTPSSSSKTGSTPSSSSSTGKKGG